VWLLKLFIKIAFWRPFEELEAENRVKNDNCDEEFKNKDLNVSKNNFECLKRKNNQECNTFIVKQIAELTKLTFSTISRVIKKENIIDHSTEKILCSAYVEYSLLVLRTTLFYAYLIRNGETICIILILKVQCNKNKKQKLILTNKG